MTTYTHDQRNESNSLFDKGHVKEETASNKELTAHSVSRLIYETKKQKTKNKKFIKWMWKTKMVNSCYAVLQKNNIDNINNQAVSSMLWLYQFNTK